MVFTKQKGTAVPRQNAESVGPPLKKNRKKKSTEPASLTYIDYKLVIKDGQRMYVSPQEAAAMDAQHRLEVKEESTKNDRKSNGSLSGARGRDKVRSSLFERAFGSGRKQKKDPVKQEQPKDDTTDDLPFKDFKLVINEDGSRMYVSPEQADKIEIHKLKQGNRMSAVSLGDESFKSALRSSGTHYHSVIESSVDDLAEDQATTTDDASLAAIPGTPKTLIVTGWLDEQPVPEHEKALQAFPAEDGPLELTSEELKRPVSPPPPPPTYLCEGIDLPSEIRTRRESPTKKNKLGFFERTFGSSKKTQKISKLEEYLEADSESSDKQVKKRKTVKKEKGAKEKELKGGRQDARKSSVEIPRVLANNSFDVEDEELHLASLEVKGTENIITTQGSISGQENKPRGQSKHFWSFPIRKSQSSENFKSKKIKPKSKGLGWSDSELWKPKKRSAQKSRKSDPPKKITQDGDDKYIMFGEDHVEYLQESTHTVEIEQGNAKESEIPRKKINRFPFNWTRTPKQNEEPTPGYTDIFFGLRKSKRKGAKKGKLQRESGEQVVDDNVTSSSSDDYYKKVEGETRKTEENTKQTNSNYKRFFHLGSKPVQLVSVRTLSEPHQRDNGDNVDTTDNVIYPRSDKTATKQEKKRHGEVLKLIHIFGSQDMEEQEEKVSQYSTDDISLSSNDEINDKKQKKTKRGNQSFFGKTKKVKQRQILNEDETENDENELKKNNIPKKKISFIHLFAPKVEKSFSHSSAEVPVKGEEHKGKETEVEHEMETSTTNPVNKSLSKKRPFLSLFNTNEHMKSTKIRRSNEIEMEKNMTDKKDSLNTSQTVANEKKVQLHVKKPSLFTNFGSKELVKVEQKTSSEASLPYKTKECAEVVRNSTTSKQGKFSLFSRNKSVDSVSSSSSERGTGVKGSYDIYRPHKGKSFWSAFRSDSGLDERRSSTSSCETSEESSGRGTSLAITTPVGKWGPKKNEDVTPASPSFSFSGDAPEKLTPEAVVLKSFKMFDENGQTLVKNVEEPKIRPVSYHGGGQAIKLLSLRPLSFHAQLNFESDTESADHGSAVDKSSVSKLTQDGSKKLRFNFLDLMKRSKDRVLEVDSEAPKDVVSPVEGELRGDRVVYAELDMVRGVEPAVRRDNDQDKTEYAEIIHPSAPLSKKEELRKSRENLADATAELTTTPDGKKEAAV